MNKMIRGLTLFLLFFMISGCSTSYKAKPLSFRTPDSYENMVEAAGARIAARAFTDPVEAREAFGFDILKAGMLPVQLVFDNRGDHFLEVKGQQTFLEDAEGNLWPVLSEKTAYDRASTYSKTEKIVKESAYHGLLGAAAGSIIGAAIGIASGKNVAESAGVGAAIGGAAGATMGGAKGYSDDDARRTITEDLRKKSLQNRPIQPKNLAHGVIFFPGEARSAKLLRLQVIEEDSGRIHVVNLEL